MTTLIMWPERPHWKALLREVSLEWDLELPNPCGYSSGRGRPGLLRSLPCSEQKFPGGRIRSEVSHWLLFKGKAAKGAP